jgi:hypothetical protein
MSSNSVKDARRPTKTTRRSVQKVTKSAKLARSAVKKASKSARRVTGKVSRPLRGAAVRSPSVAPRLPSKSSPKNGAKNGLDHSLKIVRTPSPPMQPVATPEIIMRHKYQVGEAVYFTSPTFGRAATNGSYTVVKLLPSEGDDYQYRIKSSGEAFERVAKESQLDRI